MASVDQVDQTVFEKIVQLLQDAFTNEQIAGQLADDPNGVAEQYGLNSADLSDGYSVSQAALQACQAPGVPPATQAAVQHYASTPHPEAHSVQEVVQQIQQITVVNNDHSVHNTNNIDVDGDGNDIDVDNLTQGDHSVGNTGDDADVAGATGDRSNAAAGNEGPTTQTSGDGNVVAGPGGSINGPTNTGIFTGNQGQGSTFDHTQAGEGNQQANVHDFGNGLPLGQPPTILRTEGGEGGEPGAGGDGGPGGPNFNVSIPFGDGNNTNQQSHLQDTAQGTGATNSSNNTTGDGGAIGGHDAVGHFETQDNDDLSTHATDHSTAQGGYENDNDNDSDDDGPDPDPQD